MELNNLDARQLKKFISDANSALNRRQQIEKAMADIRRVLKKYKLSKVELSTVLGSVQSSSAVPTSRPKSTRVKVEPKYQSQDGAKTWTGRGRTPSWVVEICRSKGLTVEGFKSDPRFLIQSGMPSSAAVHQA